MGSRKIGRFIRLNSSRSGISASVGVKGMRISIGNRGIRSHVTIPGTGHTKTKTLVSFKKLLKNKKKEGVKGSVNPVQDELILVLEKRRLGAWFSAKRKANKVVNRGIEAFNEENYGAAVEAFGEALERMPGDKELPLFLAIIHYLYLEDYERAFAYFDALDEEMYNEDMRLAIGDCLFEMKDYGYAKTILESFKFEDDEDMERMTLLARCHMEEGNLVVAESLLKTAIGRKRKLTPYLMAAKYAMGELCLMKEDYEGAKKHLMPIYTEDSTYENIAGLVEKLALA